ncbi:MAG: AarF/ABC1/UbiB kinase family protein [Crocinitomicaceae bacterium]|nr:AarF/ABC1/UbiB kinase family protein [Crocinitomicaceae bacterium]
MADKPLKSIPTSKVKRAAKIVGTGAKVGGNYLKYYTKKAFNPSLTKEELHEDNASDIYETLSELKGSALKVAQMMSMDQQVLPKAYQDKFALSQFNAPPLSYPLIAKTFQSYFGKSPEQLYDKFNKVAVNAASIGQVHQAELNGQKLAVKIQYPGVAEAISSDLKMVKPLAAQLFNMKSADLNMYMEEVESKLVEETDYLLEMRRGQEIMQALEGLPNLVFPHYHPDLCAARVLTMNWIDGLLFADYCKQETNQEKRNQIGQTLWDFFLYQMAELRMVHADPHPGNFIITKDNRLGVIDFGCVKEIPDDFAFYYFKLLRPGILLAEDELTEIYEKMDFFRPEDTTDQKLKLKEVYQSMISTLAKPFHSDTFDFSDETYFKEIFEMGEAFSKDKTLRKMNNARGSRHSIYIMRTFFGLYNLLHQLKVSVKLNYPLYEYLEK